MLNQGCSNPYKEQLQPQVCFCNFASPIYCTVPFQTHLGCLELNHTWWITKYDQVEPRQPANSHQIHGVFQSQCTPQNRSTADGCEMLEFIHLFFLQNSGMLETCGNPRNTGMVWWKPYESCDVYPLWTAGFRIETRETKAWNAHPIPKWPPRMPPCGPVNPEGAPGSTSPFWLGPVTETTWVLRS